MQIIAYVIVEVPPGWIVMDVAAPSITYNGKSVRGKGRQHQRYGLTTFTTSRVWPMHGMRTMAESDVDEEEDSYIHLHSRWVRTTREETKQLKDEGVSCGHFERKLAIQRD